MAAQRTLLPFALVAKEEVLQLSSRLLLEGHFVPTARDTSKALRSFVYPVLKNAGFDDWTTRKAWRRKGDRIDHVEFVSFSPNSATAHGCTTASVGVRLGISLPYYGCTVDPYHKDYIKSGPSGPRPNESQMPIRGVLAPSGAPPLTLGQWGKKYEWIWKIRTIEEVDDAARDIAAQFEIYGLDWLSFDWNLNELLDLLEGPQVSPVLISRRTGAHLWLDAEVAGSPIRKAHIKMVETAIGKN
jgi:hypothetical protein